MLLEPFSHCVDFCLLCRDDLIGPGFDLIIFAELQNGARHVDRALMMRDHRLDEGHIGIAARSPNHTRGTQMNIVTRNWRDLIRPRGIQIEAETLTDFYGKFTCEPLERGFGITLGNSLRRILLSSLQGAAITAVKGMGRWSAEMFLMFRLNRPDVFPVGDLGIVKGVQRLTGMKRRPAVRTMMRVAEMWRPYRSIAAWYIWRIHE